MKKKEKVRRMKKEGLHEIKNKYRIRAVNKKRKGLVLTAKKKRRVLKACASLSAIFVVLLGVFAVGTALMSSVVPNIVPDDFATVEYALPTDGSSPSDHSALENIGYMNHRFKNQPAWYAEVHGTTSTPVGPQSVNTFKQYSNGVLIMADVTSSSIVKAGRQFCYVNDEVMWREIPKNGSFKAESYSDLMDLTWNDDLTAHMTIPAFKAKNGLPGTEMTVYVINEETLDHASEVEVVESGEWDGADYAKKPVYKQTYYLRPGDSENLGAAAHYANQMAFTGGLTGLPDFKYITVTYTFDSSWQILRTEINESYTATMGISVTCVSDFKANYEYGTDKAKAEVYEAYFKDFVGQGIDDNVEKPLDALGCITSSLLTKPVSLELDLQINGKKTNGVIALDASKLDVGKVMKGDSVDIGAAIGGIGLKAKIGEISLYLEDSTAYLSVSGLKAKLPIDDLLSLITVKQSEETEKDAAENGTAEDAAETTDETADGTETEKKEEMFVLGDLVVSEEGGVKTATLACKLNLGKDLKIPLNFAFVLGEGNSATLKSLDLNLNYQGIDAEVSVKSTEKNVPDLQDRESYIDLYPYAETVYQLISGGMIDLSIDYKNDDMSLAGNVGIDFRKGLLVAGELNASVRSSEKKVLFALKEGKAYLNLDGIKLAIPVSDAVDLVSGFVSGKPSADTDLTGLLNRALSAVFDHDLAALLSLSEEENVLTLGIKGTELLSFFGVDFALGDVNLGIDRAGVVTANAFGAELVLKEANEIAFDETGYIDVMPYAQSLVNLFKSKTLTAEVSYGNKNLGGKAFAIDGKITIGLSPIEVSGNIKLTYGALQKNVEIVYDEEGCLYLKLDALKVKANVKDAVALLSSLLTTDEEGTKEKADVYAILEKVLSVNFGEILSVSETVEGENRTLKAVVDGTKLLKLFGADFALGDVVLSVEAEKVTASALGANVSLVSGGAVKELTDGEKAAYADLKPVLKKLPALLEKKALSLNGKIQLTAGETDILLNIDRGVLSFADGVRVYLDASLVLSGMEMKLKIAVDTQSVKVALGNLGAEVKFADLDTLGNKVVDLYAQLRATVNPALESKLLPEARSVTELFNVLSSLLKKDGKGNGESGKSGFSVDSLLSSLSVENSKKANGILAVKIAGATLDVLDGGEDGLVDIALSFAKNDFKASGNFASAVYGGKMPQMPKIDYLGTADFAELLDYLVAALNTLSENHLNLTLSGRIGDADTAKYPDGVKYNLNGEVRLYSGENTAIHLDIDKKNLWVDTDTYLYADVSLDPVSEEDKGIYLQFYVLDCDENGAKDGVLDVFVSVSMRKKSVASDPLTLYAPATEIMPVLSSALALLGADDGIVKDYILAPWISEETTAQLKGFGGRILNLVNSLLGGTATADEEIKKTFDLNALVSAVNVGENKFELSLDRETIFGAAGDPLKISIGKETAENRSRLTLLALENIGTASLSVGIDYEEKERVAPSFKGSLSLNGIASLLQTVARSTTHLVDEEVISGEEKPHKYDLNKNFYIDGNIVLDINAVNLLKEKLNIKVVAFSITIDEEGVWGVNVRFEYDALKVIGITAINGNTQVDLTGKDNMVYIKRVQTTDADGKPLSKPETIYRAMPLSNFVKDLIPQAGFLFNLGSSITDLLAGIDMSGSGGAAAEKDLGATVRDYFTSIEYTNGQDVGETWKITLNGAGLTGNTLGDIVVTLGSDKNGKLRTLTAHTSLSASGISMAIDANLTYRNPCGVMDAGVKDITTDIAALLTDGMSYKLETVDWTANKFIEGNYTSVDYVLLGKVIKTQDIVISTGADGTKKGTVYGTLSYPDLTPYQTEKGYKADWVTYYGKDDPLPDSRQIFARYNPLTYRLTFDFKDGERVTCDYLYGDGTFALPFKADERVKVVAFTDADGNVYRTANDLTLLSGDAELTAVYEDVLYTVTFIVGDETEVQTATYGETVEYPVSCEKAGYTFAGWDVMPATVTENVTITAQWSANVYAVTFVSAYPIDGYEWTVNADGTYSTSFAFTYDSRVELPSDVRVTADDKTFVLRGFCFADGSACASEILPNVTEDTAFIAEWTEVGYDLIFVRRDGTRVVLNYLGGETVPASALPAIAVRDGYTSAWQDSMGNKISGGYYVSGEETFTVSDTPNVYTVTLVSSQFYSGFTAADGVYKKAYSYTYDGEAVVFENLSDIHGYWFKGFYTEENGAGEKVGKAEGILEDTDIYVYWQDNTVTFRIYSDVEFAGSALDTSKNGYYKSYSLNDNYDLDDSYLPAIDGYQTLALWRETGSGFERVTNVRDLDGADVWVLWIKNVSVKITDFSGNKTYTLKGFVAEKSGDVYGTMSHRIFDSIGGKVETVVQYSIFSDDGKHTDNLKYNKEVVINADGTFGDEDMTSFNALFWTAGYGGVRVTKKFSYNVIGASATITTTTASYVSKDVYTVTFHGADGIVTIGDIRADYPYDDIDNKTYIDGLAKLNGIAVPEKEGYTGVWAHEEIRASGDIYPVYAANAYSVTLRGGEEFKDTVGWNYDEVENDYYKTFDMYCGETVELVYRNETVKTFTVGVSGNVFDLAAYLPDGAYCLSFDTGMNSFKVYAQSNPDTVVLNSAIAFNLDGAPYTSFTDEFDVEYSLPEVSVDGYVFLGWWKSEGGVWSKITGVQYAGGGNTTTVEALWQKNALEISVKGSKSGFWNYTTTVQVTSVKYSLIGAFASDDSVQVKINYHYHIGTATVGKYGETDSENTTWTWKNSFDVPNSASVTATLKYVGANGKEIYSQQASASCNF